ncbi:OsmC family protein [Salinibacter grassmerensis]|uniref:OsmC family protein n=1 Tax=Salinibacter grassmerensis TaxID=3040353 RepID=UPI0021E793B4|nr:OsmC family protein [Salinibacter grassmerensis]
MSEKSCLTLNIDNFNDFAEQVQEDPSKADFSFTTTTRWQGGAQSETEARGRTISADEPEDLGGQDSAIDPVELLLASLGSCLSIGLVTQAAKRDVDFNDFEIEVTGDLDLRGYLGVDDTVRPGFTNIEYTVRIDSDAEPEVLHEILEAAEAGSPMYDNILNGVSVTSNLETEPALAGDGAPA